MSPPQISSPQLSIPLSPPKIIGTKVTFESEGKHFCLGIKFVFTFTSSDVLTDETNQQQKQTVIRFVVFELNVFKNGVFGRSPKNEQTYKHKKNNNSLKKKALSLDYKSETNLNDERKSLSIAQNVISMDSAPYDVKSVLASRSVMFVHWRTMSEFMKWRNETDKEGKQVTFWLRQELKKC